MKPSCLIVCLVDDDEIYRYGFKRTIIKSKIAAKVELFNDGQQALNFYEDNLNNPQVLPDVIFLDLNMPVMDGFQFIEEFKKIQTRLDKKVRIYMVSSSINPADIERALKTEGLTDYLVKPVHENQLIKIIEGANLKGKR